MQLLKVFTTTLSMGIYYSGVMLCHIHRIYQPHVIVQANSIALSYMTAVVGIISEY